VKIELLVSVEVHIFSYGNMVISCAASAREGPVILELVNVKQKKKRAGFFFNGLRINVKLNNVR